MSVVAELRADNQAEKERRSAASDLAIEAQADEFYAELVREEPHWEAVFGKGSGRELSRTEAGRKLMSNRLQHLDARDTLATGLQSRKQPIPVGRNALLKKALPLAFADQIKEFTEKKVTTRLRGRGGPPMPRPGGPTPRSDSSKPAKPIDRIGNTMAGFGMPTGD